MKIQKNLQISTQRIHRLLGFQNEEMFARAFACYVEDQARALDITDDYLCGHADTCVAYDDDMNIIPAYPQGEERKRINKAFDELITALKEKGYFPKSNTSTVKLYIA